MLAKVSKCILLDHMSNIIIIRESYHD